MTRKQALCKVLEGVTDNEVRDKINEILDDMPFTGWSERTIFDAIDQFIIDNRRIPTATDFKKKGLPPHPVIKLRFGINLAEFLKKHYPDNKLCNSKIYYIKTREEWQEDFIYQYKKRKPSSAEEYNSLRLTNTPSWGTVARLYKIMKWNEWLDFCELNKYSKSISKPKEKSILKISSHNDLEID